MWKTPVFLWMKKEKKISFVEKNMGTRNVFYGARKNKSSRIRTIDAFSLVLVLIIILSLVVLYFYYLN